MKWYFLTYYFVILFGLIIGILRFKKLANCNKLIVLLLAATLLDEIVAEWLRQTIGNDSTVYIIFQPIEYSLITVAYFIELQKKWLLWTILIYSIIAIINAFFLQQMHLVFGSNMILITILLTSIWALLYLRNLLKHPTEIPLRDFTLFWFSFGFLLFNASCLIVYGTYNFIGENMYDLVGGTFRVIRITANHTLYIMILLSLMNKQKSIRATSVI